MLIADNLAIAGRHLPLLDPTSLAVARGELLLIQADTQTTRTALSLGLSARMRPSEGSVSWLGDSSLKAVRRISAIVDSPQINDPEAHMKVRDLVAEDLSLIPGSRRRRPKTKTWIQEHHLESLADQYLDAIEPLDRLTLMTELALEDANVELLVFDTPDRHGIPEEMWCTFLESVSTGERAPAIIAVVQRLPEQWSGPTAYDGGIQDKLEVPFGSIDADLPADEPTEEPETVAAPAHLADPEPAPAVGVDIPDEAESSPKHLEGYTPAHLASMDIPEVTSPIDAIEDAPVETTTLPTAAKDLS